MINVAFFTLLERKILGLSQLRKGPNKVSLGGFLQPIGDAVKLFIKENVNPYKVRVFYFLIAPRLGLRVVLTTWTLLPDIWGHFRYRYSVALFLILLALNIYPLFFAGWASRSKYALLGATRGIAQSVSYEIRLSLIILCFLRINQSIQLYSFVKGEMILYYIFVSSPLLLLWVVCCVAETNRSPFDFAEGESELVSGFNIEYGAGGFALIFIAEYASILFFSYLTGRILLFRTQRRVTKAVFIIVVLGGFWVWLRCTYPRYRYDKLINLAWKRILPIRLRFCLFYFRVRRVYIHTLNK